MAYVQNSAASKLSQVQNIWKANTCTCPSLLVPRKLNLTALSTHTLFSIPGDSSVLTFMVSTLSPLKLCPKPELLLLSFEFLWVECSCVVCVSTPCLSNTFTSACGSLLCIFTAIGLSVVCNHRHLWILLLINAVFWIQFKCLWRLFVLKLNTALLRGRGGQKLSLSTVFRHGSFGKWGGSGNAMRVSPSGFKHQGFLKVATDAVYFPEVGPAEALEITSAQPGATGIHFLLKF